ncbi:hypothetical protein IMZ48_26335, partial [Candidatus Bathyarchaeota archaeon]|nr:hypothetical protein [Candidatus Bathyarchaeota archaeon]
MMAPSRSKSGSPPRSSARIQVLADRQVTARFVNPRVGDRPRTRAEKAAFEHAMRRNGDLLQHFSISKRGSNRGKVSDNHHDDTPSRSTRNRPPTIIVIDDSDDDDTPMPRRGRSSNPETRGEGKRKCDPTKLQVPAKRRRLSPRIRVQRAPVPESEGGHETTSNWLGGAMLDCWPEIFRQAAADSDTTQGWLLQAATVCRALARPALDVLYENPRITSDKKMQKLIATLEFPETLFYYRGMIHSLHLGPEFLPRASSLETLVRCLPRLKHFSTTHELDQAPYRDLETMGPRTDPKFWAVLDERAHSKPDRVPSQLLSWKWSGRLLPDFLSDSQEIIRLHTSGPLRNVKSLHLANFPRFFYIGEDSPAWNEVVSQMAPMANQGLVDDEVDADEIVTRRCAQVINSLDHLEHLVLESCWVVEGVFWQYVPRRLKHLEVTHCWNLNSVGLQQFLAPNGQNLETLVLNNNVGLSIDFLVDLRRHCPNLQKLVVNMWFYRSSLKSAEPEFEQALGEGQVPTWPSSLRHLELLHVRPWKPEAAATLFQSLIDSASELPNLRYLVIKSMLDLAWRERAGLRAHWLQRFQTVFLRPAGEPPAPTPRLQPTRKATPDAGNEAPKSRRKTSAGPATRRSGHTNTQPTPSSRRSSRLNKRDYAEPSSDPEDDSDGELSTDSADSDVEMLDV